MSIYPKPVSLKRAIRNASRMGRPMTPAEKLLDRAYKLLVRTK